MGNKSAGIPGGLDAFESLQPVTTGQAIVKEQTAHGAWNGLMGIGIFPRIPGYLARRVDWNHRQQILDILLGVCRRLETLSLAVAAWLALLGRQPCLFIWDTELNITRRTAYRL